MAAYYVDVGPYDLADDGVKDAAPMMAAYVSGDLDDEGGSQKVTVVDQMMCQYWGQWKQWRRSLELSKALSRKANPTASESGLVVVVVVVVVAETRERKRERGEWQR